MKKKIALAALVIIILLLMVLPIQNQLRLTSDILPWGRPAVTPTRTPFVMPTRTPLPQLPYPLDLAPLLTWRSPVSALDLKPAPAAMRLDVRSAYTGPALSGLGATAIQLGYADPKIQLSQVLTHAGSGAFEVDRSSAGFDITSFGPKATFRAAKNLGYALMAGYVGEPSNSLKFWLGLVDEANKVKFNNERDAFDFLKKVIASNMPTQACLDSFYVHDEISQGSQTLPKQHAPLFVVVTGYDDGKVYFDDAASRPEGAKDNAVSAASFLEAWSKGGIEGGLGPNYMAFFKKTGTEKGPDDAVSEIKADGLAAGDGSRSLAEALQDPKTAFEGDSFWAKVVEPTVIMRTTAVQLLKDREQPEAAAAYDLALKRYKSFDKKLKREDAIKLLTEAAELEAKGAEAIMY